VYEADNEGLWGILDPALVPSHKPGAGYTPLRTCEVCVSAHAVYWSYRAQGSVIQECTESLTRKGLATLLEHLSVAA
jgi:hypothetical protein